MSRNPTSPSPHPPRKQARRPTRDQMAERDARIVRSLARGMTTVDIAKREGLSARRARELTAEIFSRRRDAPPQSFLELQITRLNEAMIVSYAAMGGGNLKAVDRVIRIVREFDRYYGFRPVDAPSPFDALDIERRQNGLQVFDKPQSAAVSPAPFALSAPQDAPLDPAAETSAQPA
jgi:ribosomal protein L13E